MVRVIPKNDTLRKLLKHPVGGPFRAEGAAEWPSDSFTARRIADGDVTVEEAPKEGQASAPQPAAAETNEKKSRSPR